VIARRFFLPLISYLELQQIGGRLIAMPTWNEFKAIFRSHYVPHDIIKLKKQEFSDLRQNGMMVNEYLNQFTKLSRYSPDKVNTNERKHDVFLKRLTDDF
jgi:hypothetical protein